MCEKDDELYRDVKRNHYENLIPLVKQARESLEDIMDSEDEKVKLRASKFVLENAGEWLSGARKVGDDGLLDLDCESEPDTINPSILEELTD